MLDYDPDIDYAPEREAGPKPRIDPAVYQQYVDLRRTRQHHPLALLGGTIGAAIGVTIWLSITMTVNVEAEWMAIAVGLLAGGMVRISGVGFDRIFGVLGGLLTAVGCFVGALVSGCHFAALNTEGTTALDAFAALTPTIAREIFSATYDPMDVVFYGIALLAGFRISYRRLSKVDKATLLAHSGPDQRDVHANAA